MLNTTFSAAVSIVSGRVLIPHWIYLCHLYTFAEGDTGTADEKKVLAAFLPEPAVGRILDITALTERTFSHFLTGQCAEAVILGTMFFVVLTRYTPALCTADWGADCIYGPDSLFSERLWDWAVGVFLMLMVDPMDALIFTITFFVLQQIEGKPDISLMWWEIRWGFLPYGCWWP